MRINVGIGIAKEARWITAMDQNGVVHIDRKLLNRPADIAEGRFLRTPSGGNKGLKRVFYQSAFCSLAQSDSRAFYNRERREGKRHHQAIIALARRRVNVLWAVVHNRTPFQTDVKTAA